MTLEASQGVFVRNPVNGVSPDNIFDYVDRIYYPADEYQNVLAERRRAADETSQRLTARAEEYLEKRPNGHRKGRLARAFPKAGSMPFTKSNRALILEESNIQ